MHWVRLLFQDLGQRITAVEISLEKRVDETDAVVSTLDRKIKTQDAKYAAALQSVGFPLNIQFFISYILYRYVRANPTCFSIGDIVEARLSFLVVPVSKGTGSISTATEVNKANDRYVGTCNRILCTW
jgi:hypothetical protein